MRRRLVMESFVAPLLCAIPLCTAVLAGRASAVTIDWVTVGNPGNACDPQAQGCFGAVPYTYQISKYEVTNAQYVEFLNAKAASDPLGLYHPNMEFFNGGITRSGSSGSFTYSVNDPPRADHPVNWVSVYDSMRFANWLHNGQGSGDTETGAYTLLGGTPLPSNGTTVTRNAGAAIFLTNENEWYKAAYHNAIGLSATDYFDYPLGSNTQTACGFGANCEDSGGDPTPVGMFWYAPSPYGTFDQGGNVFEWTETISAGTPPSTILNVQVRGGWFGGSHTDLAASARLFINYGETFGVGIRLASVPEPAAGLLVMTGLLGIAAWRRRRA